MELEIDSYIMNALNQLIIIGNGFDLNCGLKSAYIDFFESRYTPEFIKKLTTPNYDASEIDSEGISIWDLYFYYMSASGQSLHGDKKWLDVESMIANIIESADDELRSIKKISPNSNTLSIQRGVINYLLIGALILARYCDGIIDITSKNIQRHEFSGFKDILIKELNIFEAIFQKYLKSIALNDKYIKLANIYISTLIEQDIAFSENQLVNNSILSFNYTKPFRSDDRRFYKIKNVHGDIFNKIIFGVDGFNKSGSQENIRANDSKLPFTKTFRTLSISNNYSQVYNNDAERTLIGDYELHAIKVFGHSLGKADYSYYQSIFDNVNLYSSRAKLFFYYGTHGQNETATQIDTYLSVAKLLEDYGSTLDNKDHGNNLMHKLQLEERLYIKKFAGEPHGLAYKTMNDPLEVDL